MTFKAQEKIMAAKNRGTMMGGMNQAVMIRLLHGMRSARACADRTPMSELNCSPAQTSPDTPGRIGAGRFSNNATIFREPLGPDTA